MRDEMEREGLLHVMLTWTDFALRLALDGPRGRDARGGLAPSRRLAPPRRGTLPRTGLRRHTPSRGLCSRRPRPRVRVRVYSQFLLLDARLLHRSLRLFLLLLADGAEPLSLRYLVKRRGQTIKVVWLITLLAFQWEVVVISVGVAHEAQGGRGDVHRMARDIG